jgi:hypothetical protein
MGIFGLTVPDTVNTTRYNALTTQYGTLGFWMRYLVSISGVCTAITTTEITFIHSKSAKIIFIWNGAHSSQVSTAAQGTADAASTVAALTALGVPTSQGYIVYNDIESNWPVTSAYMIAYYNGVISSYAVGFYGPTAQTVFNTAFCAARTSVGAIALFTPHPQLTTYPTPPSLPTWNPNAPSCITQSNISFWQYKISGDTVYNYDLVEARDALALSGEY